jgi:hypothetical protein
MKTHTLIDLLSENNAEANLAAPSTRYTACILGLSVIASVITFMLGWRAIDGITSDPLQTGYALKVFLGLGTALMGIHAWRGLTNAETSNRQALGLLTRMAAPLILLLWLSLGQQNGDNAAAAAWRDGLGCIASVWVIGAPLWLALVWHARNRLPTRLALTGGVSAAIASGIGACIFALSCAETAPLYVAVWYGLAIGVSAVIGSLVTPRLIRW